MSTALNRLGALEAARKLQRRELTAVQLVRACFARIEQRENTIHAWTALQKQAALDHAEALDRSPLRGPLHGLPIGVKDLFDTVDLPTRYGSPIYERHHPGLDAAAVALCRHAGAIVIGKTVTTEFATYQAGPTRNPRNEAYTPGGSSSGSAAAVADDMVPFALGSQTAGSIIRPASYCGIVGYKPTFGAIPRAGVKSLAESLDTVGGFARSVPDVALFASVLMRDPRLLNLSYDAKPRIGMYRSLQWRHAQSETKEAFAQAAATLSRAGAHVEEVPLPPEHCMLVQLHADIMAFESSQSLAYERLEHAAQLSPKIQAILEAGAQISAEEHIKNLARAAESRAGGRLVRQVRRAAGARGQRRGAVRRPRHGRSAVLARLDPVRPAVPEPAVRHRPAGPAGGPATDRQTLRRPPHRGDRRLDPRAAAGRARARHRRLRHVAARLTRPAAPVVARSNASRKRRKPAG
ncbi:Glutamyl-tRNA(Gln) amidotransferase subunit A, chloroplastic/mitochondrial [Achromobacter dolens]|uniref:Glutamyl-tRNA(Gln) amidotransferase subunit A, chloroplastic/mitochondrial n=1 Tax=Achromobacter dolens TaxID=1287738 RepID=A0A6S7D1Q6_9BURK|nr:Glutamyl-tRNA(Gln) amidotransferase subunit A, chloroplastic/mitochondrial [Achromobacter dolens]